MKKKVDPSLPFLPVPAIPADAYALKAMAAGTATPDQQKRALRWIIWNACETYTISFRPDSVRNSDFAEGKRFIGSEISRLVNLTPKELRRMENEYSKSSNGPAADSGGEHG